MQNLIWLEEWLMNWVWDNSDLARQQPLLQGTWIYMDRIEFHREYESDLRYLGIDPPNTYDELQHTVDIHQLRFIGDTHLSKT